VCERDCYLCSSTAMECVCVSLVLGPFVCERVSVSYVVAKPWIDVCVCVCVSCVGPPCV